jgi:hypothetical protein
MFPIKLRPEPGCKVVHRAFIPARTVKNHPAPATLFRTLTIAVLLWRGGAFWAAAQVDPYPRSLLQLGYDHSLSGQGPQSLYVYYYYNNPGLWRTNVALRLAVAPVYFDGELGFRQLLSPHTDLGIGLNGGVQGENYYEVRQGDYVKGESFAGHGGGASLNLYHRINPAQFIPLNLVLKAGGRYSTYSAADKTDAQFELPADRLSPFARAGLRFAGKEPMLYTDLAMEISVWYERQWRGDDSWYGFANDRRVQPATDLYWLYAGLNYAWTNTGNQFTFGLTAGGSEAADRFSAYRLGGVLPLASEFPLTLPGYYYQEISARRFLHLSAAYVVPLSADHRWQLRLGAASAYVDYLPGLEQSGHWPTGVGPSLSFTSRSDVWRVILRYGYGFNAKRDGDEGAHSVGLLYQYNFAQRKVRIKGTP